MKKLWLAALMMSLTATGYGQRHDAYATDSKLTSPSTYGQRRGTSARTISNLPKNRYSMSTGGGMFYALRHNKEGQKPLIEIVASDIALNRAKNQAREGEYNLDIKGPFSGIMETTVYIQENWDHSFGRRKPVTYDKPGADSTKTVKE